MLAEYFRETAGAESVVTDHGFLAYQIRGTQFFITDFFIAETHRKSLKHFRKLFQAAYEKAAEHGCESLACRVQLQNAAVSQRVFSYLKFGFRITEASPAHIGMILWLKDCEWAAVAEIQS